ncbi:ribonuclease H-like domain-containing protein [Favolaschia claudopus]|uniref:3'-5' exonuclease n=1 Tax=Favolaschia claudopus TaxID=2862362 RepID=A0AAW0A5D9_9AGAR
MNSQSHRFGPDNSAALVNLGNEPGKVLPPYDLTKDVIVIFSVAHANARLKEIRSNSIVGFDTEYIQGVVPIPSKLCVVQITTEDFTYVLDMTAIHGCPIELRRILEDSTIIKTNTGISNDGKVIWDAFHINVRNFQELGVMARIVFPISYRLTSSPLSLRQCVADILHFDMSKDERRTDWERGLRDDSNGRNVDKIVKYAALDSQAAYEIYLLMVNCLAITEAQRAVHIPVGWYGYDCHEGKTMRFERDIDEELVEWSVKDCRWFVRGRFSNFWP